MAASMRSPYPPQNSPQKIGSRKGSEISLQLSQTLDHSKVAEKKRELWEWSIIFICKSPLELLNLPFLLSIVCVVICYYNCLYDFHNIHFISALPDIRKSRTADVALLHNDFLPDEVMLALTQPSDLTMKTLLPSRERSLAIGTVRC